MRFVTFTLLLPLAVPLACGGDTETTPGGTAGQPSAGTAGQAGSSGGSAGSSAGKGGSAGKAGATSGGSAGTSTGGAGTGGGAGEGGESGEASGGTAMGGEAGMGDAGMGATGGTAGAGNGGTAGATAGGAGTSGTAGAGGAGNGGTAGAGAGGVATGGTAGAGAGGAGSGGVAGTAGGGGSGGTVSESLCSDGIDNDGDTFTDCADSDCAAACSLTCPSGTSKMVYRASGLPVAIPDNNLNMPALATLTIPDAGLVSTFAVQTSITHPFTGDLDISIVTPYGIRELSSDNGTGGDNYIDTVFNDAAATAITAGTAPYTGAFRPEQAFTTLSGMALAGTYELRVADDSVNDTGQLTSFSVAVCQCLAGSGNCEFGPYACVNGVDDDGDDLVDCEEADCAGSDVCPAQETSCGDATDNDGNGQTDCADASCAWACTALGSACTSPDQLFVYRPTNLPQTIPTSGTGSFPAPISVAAQGTLVAAAVRFNAAHTWSGDLLLRLASPFGVDRLLSDRNGESVDDYINTVFIDSAATAISSGVAPFTGSYRPEEPLSAWAGDTVAGVWSGVLYDIAGGDGGTFTELSLGLCVAE